MTMQRASSASAVRLQLKMEVPKEGPFTWDYHPASTRRLKRSTHSANCGSRRSSVATQRHPLTLDHACVCIKSIVREGASLDSPEMGNLRVGTMVVVLDECTMPDGVVRSWVGRESVPRGINVESIGWITSSKPKSDNAAGQNALERPGAGDTIESLASRIVQHHASLAAERVVVIPTVGPGDWMTTDTLTMHATAQRKLARNLEEKIFDQCEERVGILLVELDMAFDEEVPRRCDAIGAGDSLGRDQFRTLVRGLKSPGALITQDIGSDADLDQIFRSFDIDGGGSMDRREVAAAFAKLKVAHKRPKYKAAADTITAQRKAAAALDAAAADLRQLEMLEAEFAAFGVLNVSIRLGDLLNKRKVKSQDLRSLWDKNGDGKLDAGELANNLDEFGFERTQEEDRELFGILDTDGGGTLTIKELMSAMSQLVTDSKNHVRVVAEKKSKVEAAREAAEQAQISAVAMMVIH